MMYPYIPFDEGQKQNIYMEKVHAKRIIRICSPLRSLRKADLTYLSRRFEIILEGYDGSDQCVAGNEGSGNYNHPADGSGDCIDGVDGSGN